MLGCPPAGESDVAATTPSESFEGSGRTATLPELPNEPPVLVLDGNGGGFHSPRTRDCVVSGTARGGGVIAGSSAVDTLLGGAVETL